MLARDGRADGGPSLEEAGRLEPMLGAVLAYGQQHPDVFGSYGLIWHSATDASVFLGVTRDIEVHRAALGERVEQPDDLIVCRSALNDSGRRALVAELDPELRERAAGWSFGTDGVDVHLPDREERYAAELLARYGERLEIDVGRFPYPMPDPLPESQCEPLPDTQPVDGLSVSVVPVDEPISDEGGEPAAVTVRLRNVGAAPIAVSFGAPTATLLEAGTRRVVGGFVGAVADVLDHVSLAPGGEATRTVLVGTASCDPAIGYRVPADTYDMVVTLQRPGTEGGPLVTEPIQVTGRRPDRHRPPSEKVGSPRRAGGHR